MALTEEMSALSGTIGNAQGSVILTLRPGEMHMPGSKPCEPGCDCPKHDGRNRGRRCLPGCDCGRHTRSGPPRKTAEEKAEYHQNYREERREEAREYARNYRAENPEKVKEANRKWVEANRDYSRERNRKWRADNRDKAFESKLARRHDMTLVDWQEWWDAHGGRCYLCGDPLDGVKAVIDHDHACCPKNRSCAKCRRGLACGNCNSLVGFAGDDPDRLERIVANFRIAADAAQKRIGKPAQAELFDINEAASRHKEKDVS